VSGVSDGVEERVSLLTSAATGFERRMRRRDVVLVVAGWFWEFIGFGVVDWF